LRFDIRLRIYLITSQTYSIFYRFNYPYFSSIVGISTILS